MDINYIELILKSSITFLILLIMTRLLGKKQMGHLSFFNYITGITIGSIAANIVSIRNENFLGELVVLLWWCILGILIDYLSFKVPFTRGLIVGDPTIIIKNGSISEKSLKKTKLTIDNLTMLLREEGIFSIQDVEYAILESNGEITVFKKNDHYPVLRKDLNIVTEEPKYMPCELIVNGKIIKKNLKEVNLDIDWLKQKLSEHGIDNYKDVLYAELEENGEIYLQASHK